MSRKTAPEKRQRAELRVVFATDEGTALVMFVEVRGKDIYAGTKGAAPASRMRTSYHETGKRHMHTALGRFGKHDDVPPSEIGGYKQILQTTTLATEWTYKAKADVPGKLTMLLDAADYPDGACVMALAVESARRDLIEAFQRGVPFRGLEIEVGASLIADWTDPAIILLALRWLPESVAKFRAQIAKDGGDPSEKLNGFVLGPAPFGMQWTELGKIAADGTVTLSAPLDS